MKTSQLLAGVFVLFALIFTVIVFPSMPTLVYGAAGTRARNNNVPYGVVMVALLLLAIAFDTVLKKQKYFLAIYAFVVFWIFGHGERVEILGFLSYLGLRYLNQIDVANVKESIKRHKKTLIFSLAGLLIIVAAIIGIIRITGEKSISPRMVINSILVQGTAGDTIYDFNCATHMWKNGELLYGYTYLDYLLQFIPGATTKYTPASILLRRFNTMGGSLFYAEGMMNFGIIGVIIFNIVFCLFMNRFLKNKKNIISWMWIPIVIEVFRICWYGIDGWILASFVEVPLLYLSSIKHIK